MIMISPTGFGKNPYKYNGQEKWQEIILKFVIWSLGSVIAVKKHDIHAVSES